MKVNVKSNNNGKGARDCNKWDLSPINSAIEKVAKEYIEARNKVFMDCLYYIGLTLDDVKKSGLLRCVILDDSTKRYLYGETVLITEYPQSILRDGDEVKITVNRRLNYLKLERGCFYGFKE